MDIEHDDCDVNMGDDEDEELAQNGMQGSSRFSIDSAALKPKRQLQADFVLPQEHAQLINKESDDSSVLNKIQENQNIIQNFSQDNEESKITPQKFNNEFAFEDEVQIDQPPLVNHVENQPGNDPGSSSEYQLFEVQCNPALNFKYKIPKQYESAKIDENCLATGT